MTTTWAIYAKQQDGEDVVIAPFASYEEAIEWERITKPWTDSVAYHVVTVHKPEEYKRW